MLGGEVGSFSRVNSLLLVIGYNSKSQFSAESRLTSIADIPPIAPSSPNDPTLSTAKDKEVALGSTSVHPRDNGSYRYRISHQFVISGVPAEPENWRYIWQ